MNISICCVGKLKADYLLAAQNEYVLRITPYARINIYEVSEEKAPEGLSVLQECNILKKEGERLLRVVAKGYNIALDIDGYSYTSYELSQKINDLAINASPNINIFIGGSKGLSNNVLEVCKLRLSLSKMTFTHQMARVIILEQIYRAFKIIKNEPYHK